MAIVWGAWSPNSTTTKRMRLGLELSYSGDPATGSVTVTKKLYAECYYRIDDSSNNTTISGVGGTFSGARTYDFPASYSQILVWQSSSVESLTYGSTTSKSAAASVSGIDYIGSGYTVAVSTSITLPARPYSAPAAPTLNGATRVSDTRNDLGWSNNATTAAPYTSIAILRSTDDGGYVQIASLSGSATAYSDTTTSANHHYRYRVRAINSAGYATSAASSYIYNTPAPPSECSAVKTGTSEVTVYWNDDSRTETAFEIERSTDGGVTWSSPAIGSVGAGVESYVDSSAPSGSVVYRVRATRSALVSAYSNTSNEVTTLAAPAAPTVTVWPAYSPTGTVLRVSWQHNSLDGSEQTSAKIEYTRDGATTIHTQGDGQQYLDIDIDGYDPGDIITAKVQTKGLHVDYGPYSALQSTTLADDPQANITTPATDDVSVTDAPLTVEWSYTDDFAQAGWTLQLWRGETLVRTWSGTTESSQEITAQDLEDDTAYSLTLEVRSGSGFTGDTTRTFETDFTPPAVPFIETSIDGESAAVAVTAFAGVDALLPDTSYLSVARIEPDGVSTLIATDLSDGTTVTDRTPPLNTQVTYRVRAHAANGAVSYVEAQVTVITPYAHFNFGEGYVSTARLGSNLRFWGALGADQEFYDFDGREYPVMFSGTGRSEAGGVSGDVFDDDATEQAFRELAQWGRDVIYRSVRGQRIQVGVTGVRLSEGTGARITTVGVDMRRTG